MQNETNGILKANLIAKNRVNAYVKQYAQQIFAALKPFEGKKITLASGELSAKVKEALSGFLGNLSTEGGKSIQIYKNSSGYSLSLVFKTSEHYSEFSVVYQESSVYFADLKDGILEKFYEFDENNYKSDYRLDEVLAILAELKEAEEKVDQIKSKIPAFARK